LGIEIRQKNSQQELPAGCLYFILVFYSVPLSAGLINATFYGANDVGPACE